MNTRPATGADLDRLAELFDQYRIFYEQSSNRAAARALLSARLERGALSADRLCWFDRPTYIRGNRKGEMPAENLLYTIMSSPVGDLLLAGDEEHLKYIHFANHAFIPPADWRAIDALPYPAVDQLAAYFAAELREFDLPLDPEGTTFQLEVWAALEEIPYGETISYLELARRIGNPDSVRAVGPANGKNPLSIVVPCHRVIGSDGALVGYGGGLPIKEALLELEGALQPDPQLLLF